MSTQKPSEKKEQKSATKLKAIAGVVWPVIKGIWTLLTGFPAFIAVIEMIVFGIAINSFLLKPLLTPRISCTVGQAKPEGNGFRTEIQVTAKPPLYLFVTPLTWSKIYDANLLAWNAYSFFEIRPSSDPKAPKDFERLFDSDPSISKSLKYQHRFVSRDPYIFSLSVSGPSQLVEEECPFDYSVRY